MRIILAFVTLLMGSTAFAETPKTADKSWKKISDDQGIIVYQKKVKGLDTISLRGETIINAAPRVIAEVMADNTTAHEWVPLVASRKTLKELSPVHRIEYTHIKMPWPLTDRYFVNIGKAELLPDGSIRMHIKSHDKPQDLVPSTPDKVLGILHYSEFSLTSLDQGLRTHVRIEVNTDPRGSLPTWIVNAAQRSWPRDFFTGLLAQMKKRGLLKDTIGAAPNPVAH